MVIGVTNLKGGVGKTTVSQNLAVSFAHEGYSVCIVDTDINQNSMQWYEKRTGDYPQVRVFSVTDKALTKSVKAFADEYDVVLIDGTPSLSEIASRIILASDILVIPLLPSAHDLRTLEIFFQRYEQAKEFRTDIPAYFFLNQYEERETLHKDVLSVLEDFDTEILPVKWKRRAVYQQVAVDGRGVIESDNNKAKEEVRALTQALLKIAEEKFVTT